MSNNKIRFIDDVFGELKVPMKCHNCGKESTVSIPKMRDDFHVMYSMNEENMFCVKHGKKYQKVVMKNTGEMVWLNVGRV